MKLSAVNLRPYRAWILVGAVILLSLGVRFRLRDMPLERDEGEYAYAGQIILRGVPPYKEAYNMKLPGTYAAYAVIMAVFGQTPSGIHVGLAVVNAASIVLMFFLGRKLLDDITGIAAAVSYGLLSLSPSVLGLAGHATHFVVLPALGGTLLLLRALDPPPVRPSALDSPPSSDPRRPVLHRPCEGGSTFDPRLFLSGLLFGLAFVMKQQGVFFGIFGGLYLLAIPLIQRFQQQQERKSNYGRPRKNRDAVRAASWLQVAAQVAVYSAGCILPYLLTCLILWAAGVFPQFKFWTISYAAQYAASRPVFSLHQLFQSTLSVAVGPSVVMWLLGLLGLFLIWWDERLDSNRRFFILGFFLLSAASVSVGLYFRGHYFITLLPIISLLCGITLSRSLRLLKHDKTIELFWAIPLIGLFVIGILATIIGNGSVWFAMSPREVVRFVYGSTLFTEAVAAADYVKSHSPKTTRIAVLGSEPEIYFCSARRSATGYIYVYPLTERHPFSHKMQEEMIREIETGKPEYVIYVDDWYSWLPQEGVENQIAKWWPEYWARNLDLVSTIQLEGREKERIPGVLNNEKDTQLSSAGPGVERSILVFRMKL